MIEPLEGRRLLTETSLLSQSLNDHVDNATQTYTASANLPHTHDRSQWSFGFQPRHYESGNGTSPPPRHPTAEISLNGTLVYKVVYGWAQAGSTAWNPVIASEYRHPALLSNNGEITLPDDTAAAELKFTTSDMSVGRDTATVFALALQALTPDVSVTTSGSEGGDATASEGDPEDTGRYVFQRYGAPLDVPLTVNYEMSGTATPGIDYTGPQSNGTVVFDVGQVRGHWVGQTEDGVILKARADGVDDPDETAIATVLVGANYFPVGNPATVALQTATISVPNFSITTVKSGSNKATVTVTHSTNMRNTNYSVKAGSVVNVAPAPANGSFKVTGYSKLTSTTIDLDIEYIGRSPTPGTYTYTLKIEEVDTGAATASPVTVTIK